MGFENIENIGLMIELDQSLQAFTDDKHRTPNLK